MIKLKLEIKAFLKYFVYYYVTIDNFFCSYSMTNTKKDLVGCCDHPNTKKSRLSTYVLWLGIMMVLIKELIINQRKRFCG